MCRKIKCVCVNFDFIEFGGMTQRKFWYGLWCRSTSFTRTTIVSRINSATVRRGYVSKPKFRDITQCNGGGSRPLYP